MNILAFACVLCGLCAVCCGLALWHIQRMYRAMRDALPQFDQTASRIARQYELRLQAMIEKAKGKE